MIGTMIKKLRRLKDMTQEELAESLGITSKAVSQWECERTEPDISLIPAICNLFNITSDELLGINISAKQKEIDKIHDDIWEVASSGDHKRSINMWMEALKRYPDSYKLMSNYVDEVYKYSYVLDNQKEHEERALSYLDKILSSCTDSEIRNEAIITACLWYSRLGMKDKALEMANHLTWTTKSEMLMRIYTGTKKYEQLRENIVGDFSNAISSLVFFAKSKDDDGKDIFTEDEKIMLYQKQIALFKLFFEANDYMFHAQFVENPYQRLAYIYANKKDTKNLLLTANAAADCAINFDTYDPNEKYTSIVARGMTSGGIYWDDEHNRSYDLLKDYNTQEDFEFIRTDERFKKILEKLESVAK